MRGLVVFLVALVQIVLYALMTGLCAWTLALALDVWWGQ